MKTVRFFIRNLRRKNISLIYSFFAVFARDTIVKNIFLQIATKCVFFVDKYTLFSYNHIQSYGLAIVNFFLKITKLSIFLVYKY